MPSVRKNILSRSILIMVLLLAAASALVPLAAAVDLSPGSGSTTTEIAKGDPVYIRGIAAGQPQQGVRVWFIGPNFAKVTSVSVNSDSTYEYKLDAGTTSQLASGQYFVVVQHPMENGQFDIVYDASTGNVINKQLGSGMAIYQFTGAGSLQSPNAATALVRAISSQNVDDTFATVSFFVDEPTITIQHTGDIPVGTVFTLSGTTDLAAGDNLMVEIYSSSFQPTAKQSAGGFSGVSQQVTVKAGDNGVNTWSMDVDTTTFSPDEYIVKVNGITIDASATTLFNVVERTPATTQPAATLTAVIVTPTTVQAAATPATTLPVTTKKSPTGLLPVIAGIGLAAALVALRHRNRT